MKRYLIFQFACYGDCLIATAVARQIKHDEPESHITWAIASRYKSVLDGNPHVDAVMELQIDPKNASGEEFAMLQERFISIARTQEYDEVVHLQIFDRHLTSFYTTLRRTVLEIYGRPITVDISPVVHLTEAEKQNVRAFAKRNGLETYKEVILFECSPASGQSKVTPQFAIEVASKITVSRKDICFILTSPLEIVTSNPQIISGSSISFRENLDLSNYCTLFVGCSSGITWLCTSASAKRLPMIQLLDEKSLIFAGVNFDFQINGLDNKHIIEMVDFTVERVVRCIGSVLHSGVQTSRNTFNQDYKPGRYNLRFNLRRLIWLKYPLNQIYSYARKFISENRKHGNVVPISKWKITCDIFAGCLSKLIFDLKTRVKRILILIRSVDG